MRKQGCYLSVFLADFDIIFSGGSSGGASVPPPHLWPGNDLNWQPPNALIQIRAFHWQVQTQGVCGSVAIYHHQLASAPHGIDLAVHPATGTGGSRMMPWVLRAHAVSSSVNSTRISAAYFWAGDWNVAWCSLIGICCHGPWHKLLTAQQQLPIFLQQGLLKPGAFMLSLAIGRCSYLAWLPKLQASSKRGWGNRWCICVCNNSNRQ